MGGTDSGLCSVVGVCVDLCVLLSENLVIIFSLRRVPVVLCVSHVTYQVASEHRHTYSTDICNRWGSSGLTSCPQIMQPR